MIRNTKWSGILKYWQILMPMSTTFELPVDDLKFEIETVTFYLAYLGTINKVIDERQHSLSR